MKQRAVKETALQSNWIFKRSSSALPAILWIVLKLNVAVCTRQLTNWLELVPVCFFASSGFRFSLKTDFVLLRLTLLSKISLRGTSVNSYPVMFWIGPYCIHFAEGLA